jgi:hypothetical protein
MHNVIVHLILGVLCISWLPWISTIPFVCPSLVNHQAILTCLNPQCCTCYAMVLLGLLLPHLPSYTVFF